MYVPRGHLTLAASISLVREILDPDFAAAPNNVLAPPFEPTELLAIEKALNMPRLQPSLAAIANAQYRPQPPKPPTLTAEQIAEIAAYRGELRRWREAWAQSRKSLHEAWEHATRRLCQALGDGDVPGSLLADNGEMHDIPAILWRGSPGQAAFSTGTLSLDTALIVVTGRVFIRENALRRHFKPKAKCVPHELRTMAALLARNTFRETKEKPYMDDLVAAPIYQTGCSARAAEKAAREGTPPELKRTGAEKRPRGAAHGARTSSGGSADG